MLWTGIRTGFLSARGAPAWQLLSHSATASPAKRSGCMLMYLSGCVDVTEALAACRCFRPTDTSGNSAAVVARRVDCGYRTGRQVRAGEASGQKVRPHYVLSGSVPFQLPAFSSLLRRWYPKSTKQVRRYLRLG